MDETQVRRVACEEVEDALEPIRTSLWGRLHPSGTGRVSDEGMESQLKEVHEIVVNGGAPQPERRDKYILAGIRVVQTVGVAVIIKVF